MFGDSGIYVFENGSPMSDTLWHYEPNENKVVFDVLPQSGSLIEISYEY